MELDTYLRFVLALVFVLALIGAIGWAGRRFGPFGTPLRQRGNRRLNVVEIASIDARHKLVLVRRDGVEHLLMLGAGPGFLVEGGIVPPWGISARSGAEAAE
jgi:flagellar protein FliO/FliZ